MRADTQGTFILQTEEHDVVIVGAGPTGLALAIALAQANLRVAIVDTQPATALAAPPEDGREIALTHPSMRLLQRLGVWTHLRADEMGCIREARVVDGARHDRPLRFDAAHSGHAVLGAIVANQALRRASHAVAAQWPQIRLLPATRATLVRTHTSHAQVLLAPEGPMPTDDQVPAALHGRLVVAADSRFSPTRRQLGVGASMHDFGRSMIVCRMAHELPHHEIAHECFGTARTLAMLPLPGLASSVVLTSDAARTASLMALPEAEFCALVAQQFGHRLGAMRFLSPRHVYPLVGAYAERFAGHRFALAGDAAVGMHPLTAQGHNLSLQGVESLTRVLVQARAAGRDIGQATVLAAYERQHRRETALIYHGSNAIARLFAHDSGPHRLLRRMVLEGARRLPPLQWAIRRQLTGPATAAR
ncbi:MAG: FAD-dependent hydroxylase [Comamonadaceae bacterium]|nr:MAG: FAD-dependent hydroxylase [Comamonadaceae bacterium]